MSWSQNRRDSLCPMTKEANIWILRSAKNGYLGYYLWPINLEARTLPEGDKNDDSDDNDATAEILLPEDNIEKNDGEGAFFLKGPL